MQISSQYPESTTVIQSRKYCAALSLFGKRRSDFKDSATKRSYFLNDREVDILIFPPGIIDKLPLAMSQASVGAASSHEDSIAYFDDIGQLDSFLARTRSGDAAMAVGNGRKVFELRNCELLANREGNASISRRNIKVAVRINLSPISNAPVPVIQVNSAALRINVLPSVAKALEFEFLAREACFSAAIVGLDGRSPVTNANVSIDEVIIDSDDPFSFRIKFVLYLAVIRCIQSIISDNVRFV